MVYIEWGQGLKTRFRSQPGFCPNSGANCNEFTMNTTVGQKTLPGVSSSSSSRRLHPVHRLEVDYWQRKRSRRPYFLLQVNRQQSPGKDSEEDYHAALVIFPRCKALGKIFKFGNKEFTPHLDIICTCSCSCTGYQIIVGLMKVLYVWSRVLLKEMKDFVDPYPQGGLF